LLPKGNGSFSSVELPKPSVPVQLKNVESFPRNYYLPLSPRVDDNPNITVFDEVRDMLLSAILMYGVVDIRALARKQLRQCEEDPASDNGTKSVLAEYLLSLPISAKEIVRLVAKYRDDIVQEIGREATVDLYLTAFDSIQNECSSRELELELNNATLQISLVSFDLVVVSDNSSELVYAICVDTGRRRITVTFRGCKCQRDWLVCAQTILKEVDNPLWESDVASVSSSNSPAYSSRRQPSKISIHSGYYNYLFSPVKSERTGGCESPGESKFDSIIRHLRSLMQQYPGYQIYVTGHSLGAALATVFSFQAAATGSLNSCSEIPTITCINFASPMVGNYDFESAFRELENQGRIRCLRVTNYFDIFTQLPDRGNWLYLLPLVPCLGVHLLGYFGFSLFFFLCFQPHVYRHVGMNLHMYRAHKSWKCCWPSQRRVGHDENDSIRHWYKIKNSRGTSDNFAWRVVQDFKKHLKQLLQRLLSLPFVLDFHTNHSAHEHLRRITGLEHELRGITLKDLYERRSPPASPDGNIATNVCLV